LQVNPVRFSFEVFHVKQVSKFVWVFYVEQSGEIGASDLGDEFGKERDRLDRLFHVEHSALWP